MAAVPRAVAALAEDGHVYRFEKGANKWTLIGDATTLYGGGCALLGITRTGTNDVDTWSPHLGWIKIGGPGSKFAVNATSVYGLSPNRDGVYKWTGDGQEWSKVGGPARDVIAGGFDTLLATNPDSGDIYRYSSKKWDKIGGPGAEFVVDGKGHAYGVSPARDGVWKWSGSGTAWSKVYGAPVTRIYAGGSGVFMQRADSGDIYKYQGAGEAWENVGGPGEEFVVTEDGLFGRNSAGGVWKHDSPNNWTNTNSPKVKSIVASP
ncbi:hypothetical protein QBC43DRAFT_315395 [Cladorrhinum sp. PSN259]|nr:hypothetical protein QBC43DRAFT_315395 [Cladorrhinum sp. PSN259]